MTDEEHMAAPLVGEVTELRVSPDRMRAARPVPDPFTPEGRRWLSVYFVDGIGLTVALLTDEDVQYWQTVYRDRPTTED
jgi:hypothetical protein